MAFWNSERIEAQGKEIFGSQFRSSRVKSGAYEMHLKSQALVSGTDSERHPDEVCIRIAPGQFSILITEEFVSMPPETLAFISVKYSHKQKGLVNISGFHVDPGFRGNLKFSVFNASPETIYIDPRKPFFQIWFCEMTGEPSSYNGNHQNQTSFTADDYKLVDREFPSPPVLLRRINTLENQLSDLNKWKFIIASAVIASLVTLYLSFLNPR